MGSVGRQHWSLGLDLHIQRRPVAAYRGVPSSGPQLDYEWQHCQRGLRSRESLGSRPWESAQLPQSRAWMDKGDDPRRLR